ncbi:MAG: nucleoside-diphosphate sugar epimerase/dehydratase [Candidatus Omnitrophota bacterium]|nr:nucleoside-diphosphate sugar epimerase/dehydratase [Candidatus Omnitrophota bacterium]
MPSEKAFINRLKPHIKPLLVVSDIGLLSTSWWISWSLVGDAGSPLAVFFRESLVVLAVLYAVSLFTYSHMGLYRAILRYASFHFAITLVKTVTIASAIFSLLVFFLQGDFWSWQLMTLNWILTVVLIGFSRFFPRYYLESSHESDAGKRVLIFGAGEVGESVARSLLKQKAEFHPVGFIDDDKTKIGRKLHNLPIWGSRNELTQIMKKQRIAELIIAISNYPTEWLRDILKECRQQHVFCSLVPFMPGVSTQEINIKNIDIVDLLKRNPQDLDEKQIERFLHGKKILITGAAGSIGSELVRQSLRFNPERLVMVDNSEFGLYKLKEELKQKPNYLKSRFSFILQDLTNEKSILRIVSNEKPDIIFHAAAYKHVPLLESNPFSGIINNIQGTINIARAAHDNKVEKFVLISSDKAVRPTSIMGTTKRVCELFIQNLNLKSDTEYVSVRFGNVLGSSGSVIPKFLEQIAKGGPITVTHPDVTRYFMLIDEAVELVMQAAAIGHGGEIFILNMGKPVKIKEMAEDLIFLAGKEPYKEIDITFTGLRPG